MNEEEERRWKEKKVNFFFFQAEDGIRDSPVTGVQTCALPIFVISHNFAIRSIVNELLGMPLAYFHRMSLNLASVCTFDSDERGRRLTGYNSTSHLSPENR